LFTGIKPENNKADHYSWNKKASRSETYLEKDILFPISIL
jgi:hypothetical protein